MTPAKSTPRMIGPRGPTIGRSARAAKPTGPRARIFQSTGLTPIAWTATRTSLSRGSGVASSTRTSSVLAQDWSAIAYIVASSYRAAAISVPRIVGRVGTYRGDVRGTGDVVSVARTTTPN